MRIKSKLKRKQLYKNTWELKKMGFWLGFDLGLEPKAHTHNPIKWVSNSFICVDFGGGVSKVNPM